MKIMTVPASLRVNGERGRSRRRFSVTDQPIKHLAGLLLASILWLPLPLAAAGAQEGQLAPPFVLPSLSSGDEVSLDALRGKVVYVDFWASWCGPCRVSFPQLESIWQELGSQGFEVVAINLDEDPEDALTFLQESPVSYLVVRDAEGVTPQTYGILGMPTGYLLDRSGTVRHVHQGYKRSDGKKLRTSILELLGEQ